MNSWIISLLNSSQAFLQATEVTNGGLALIVSATVLCMWTIHKLVMYQLKTDVTVYTLLLFEYTRNILDIDVEAMLRTKQKLARLTKKMGLEPDASFHDSYCPDVIIVRLSLHHLHRWVAKDGAVLMKLQQYLKEPYVEDIATLLGRQSCPTIEALLTLYKQDDTVQLIPTFANKVTETERLYAVAGDTFVTCYAKKFVDYQSNEGLAQYLRDITTAKQIQLVNDAQHTLLTKLHGAAIQRNQEHLAAKRVAAETIKHGREAGWQHHKATVDEAWREYNKACNSTAEK